MNAHYKKYILNFKKPSGTSRGILTKKETFFIIIEKNDKMGIGECGILKGLSVDNYQYYEQKLNWVCKNINLGKEELMQKTIDFPSIRFGVEIAFLSLQTNDKFVLFPSDFTIGKKGIITNGLIWMGHVNFMQAQIYEKISLGFRCIKMKIGAIDFEREFEILKELRQSFSNEKIEIRVDVNGAFSYEDAIKKLEKLSSLQIHSIEQPIKQGNTKQMAQLCKNTPLPIALDEELIGVHSIADKNNLLETIQPQYIILKPSLLGGFMACEEWIKIAQQHNIKWWITSAIESNIGLNAIAQWTYTLNHKIPQGLGTGSLYTNNIASNLQLKGEKLFYQKGDFWNIEQILAK